MFCFISNLPCLFISLSSSFALAKNEREAMFEWSHKPIRELITFIQDLIHAGKRELWDFHFFFASASYSQNQSAHTHIVPYEIHQISKYSVCTSKHGPLADYKNNLILVNVKNYIQGKDWYMEKIDARLATSDFNWTEKNTKIAQLYTPQSPTTMQNLQFL